MQITDLLVVAIADWLVVPLLIIAGVAMLRIPRARRYQTYARALMTGLVALLFAKIAAFMYQGERPFVELGQAAKAAYLDNPGFPSDHMLLVSVAALVVWASTKNLKLGILLSVLGALVGLGRVLALVHTPIDVLGGVGCALLAAMCVYGRQLFVARKKT